MGVPLTPHRAAMLLSRAKRCVVLSLSRHSTNLERSSIPLAAIAFSHPTLASYHSSVAKSYSCIAEKRPCASAQIAARAAASARGWICRIG